LTSTSVKTSPWIKGNSVPHDLDWHDQLAQSFFITHFLRYRPGSSPVASAWATPNGATFISEARWQSNRALQLAFLLNSCLNFSFHFLSRKFLANRLHVRKYKQILESMAMRLTYTEDKCDLL
jgi:hypothetical protein